MQNGTPERTFQPPIDALLVHVMGAEPDAERPNARGLSIIWAATYLSYALNIPHLVFAGHHYWGETERPPLGKVTAKAALAELTSARLQRQLHILPSYPLTTREGTTLEPVTDTSGEVMAFLAFAQLHGLQHLASVSSETHVPSIRQLYQRRQLPAQVLSAEEVLLHIPGEFGHQAYAFLVDAIRHSEEEQDFKKRERLKRLLYALPAGIGEAWLRRKSKQERRISSAPTTWETLVSA